MKQTKNKIKLSVIVPVLNEGTNLRMLLPILNGVIHVAHEVLIVHDIPNDDSIPVVKTMQRDYPRLRLVHNRLGRGVINAIKSGANNAMGDYALIIAADDFGSIFAINDMVSLMDDGCDLVNGTRYAYGGKNITGSLTSKLLSIIANKLFYTLSGSALTDPTLGVKIFKHSKFNEINLESKPVGWAVSFEFAIKAQLAGWKLGEVPLISLNRIYGGKSSFKLGSWLAEYTKWFLWGLTRLPHLKMKKKVSLRIPFNIKQK
ncbi:glycosyltransferase [Candidatus Woesearchaeota archaeon]|nr:glycosyltransferase [Candidatus Woesearchaeota archaeon]